MAYATVDDYVARKDPEGELSEYELSLVETLLEDAATMLDGMVPLIDISDQHQRDVLRIVSCNMVSRSMEPVTAQLSGIDQMSYTMGPFSQSAHFANSSGDMYLSASDKRMLGISGVRIGAIRARVGHHGRRHA